MGPGPFNRPRAAVFYAVFAGWFALAGQPAFCCRTKSRNYNGVCGVTFYFPLACHRRRGAMNHSCFAPISALAFYLPSRMLAHAGLAAALVWSALATGSHAQTAPGQRQLAPGVLTKISPSSAPEETVSTHDLIEVRANPALEWKPEYLAVSDTLYGKASGVKFRRDIWSLEFDFKPLRMIEVDIPLPGSGSQRKLVWYLVYRVRNTGQVLKPVEGKGGVFTAEVAKGGPVRFVPQFVIESQDRFATGQRVAKQYLDRVIPAAVAAISERETPGRSLLNTVEMSEQPIPVSTDRIDKSVWGVATWTDIDPRIDFLSVFVGGLTNAYQWDDIPGEFKPGDAPGKGRHFARKMLQLNFWRPGDELDQSERELRYGVPLGKADLYGVGDGVAYQWVYR
jgi:hypothetical protein